MIKASCDHKDDKAQPLLHNKEKTMKERLLFFVAMFLIVFQVLISLPIAIWLDNQFNFDVALRDVAGILGFLILATAALLLLVSFIVPEKIRRRLFPIFVFGSVLIYFQQNILVWDYGILDGRQMDFSMNAHLGLIDLSLWAGGGIIAYVVFRKQLIKHAKTILSFMVVLSILATIIPILSHDFSQDKPSGSISEADKFSFSARQNIFLIILDSFQSDLFWEIIDRDIQLKHEFGGFTFYPDTASVFAKTYPAIPLLLTGKKYQKQQAFQEFIDTAYQDSILTDLINEGWDVGLYPHVKATVTLDNSIMSNYAERTRLPERLDSYLQALDLSLFRTVPHFLKSHIYNKGDFIAKEHFGGYVHQLDTQLENKEIIKLPRQNPHQGLNFLDNLKALATNSGTSPAFRFYHLYMPHAPFLLDRDLKYARMDNNFAAYREYSWASLKLMASFLEQLKNLGIYDNSAIIITADHGGGEYGDKKYISSEGGYFPILEHGRVKASGKPLLLVKDYQADGPLKFSSKPVSLLDVAPTIANFAGIEPRETEGRIIGDLVEGERRERTFYFYRFSGKDSKYLNDFDVFRIDGNVYDESAWAKTGRLSVDLEVDEKKDYLLGTTVRYGSDIKTDADYMNAFLVGGEHKFSLSYVASNNGRIDLSLGLNSPLSSNELYVLELDLASNGKTLDVRLEVDNKVLSTFGINKKKSKQIVFLEPEKLSLKDRLDLHLYNSDRTDSNDALLLSKLKLRKANLPGLGNDSVIRFADDLDSFYVQGVWPGEWWGRWTSNTKSSLYFLASDDICQNTNLLIDIKKFISSVNPESFQLALNGTKLESIKIEKKAGHGAKYFFDCSRFDRTQGRINKLVFSTDKVVSPLSLGRSGDPRTLGVGLVSLSFVDRDPQNISN